jgi:predicted ATPase
MAGRADHPGAPMPAVVLTGAPGVGKTRLVREAAGEAQVRLLECCCSRYHEATSLFPLRPLLEEACGIVTTDDPEVRLAKLRAALGEVLGGGATDLPFLASALGAPVVRAPDVDAGRMRDLAVLAAAQLLVRHAGSSPSVLFLDALQWADRSTVDVLSVLVSMPVASPALVVTTREGAPPPWPPERVARLPLDVMPEGDLMALAARMPEGADLPVERRAELVARSDGMPLFLEELVRTAVAVDQGTEPHRSVLYSDHQIPAALRDPLLARLSQSEVDLDLAQIAATVGREVDRRLLWELTGVEPVVLEERLGSLVDAGLVDEAPDGRIRFRHELVRELAYETQRLSVRRRRHGLVADLLLARGATDSGDQGQAAFHLEGAHRFAEAVEVHVASARRDLGVGG